MRKSYKLCGSGETLRTVETTINREIFANGREPIWGEEKQIVALVPSHLPARGKHHHIIPVWRVKN